MLRPGLVVVCVLASAGGARATELPPGGGMYQGGQPLPMLESKVEVSVRGAIAEAVVTQKFSNPTGNTTEAVYIFPLPADAAVTAMSIHTGGRTIKAAIERREQAQRRYEDAVAAGVGAAILDQERPDIFTQTVSAIPAHGTVEVTLRYDTVATYHDGTWQLVVPLVVAPRYVPGTASGQPTTGSGRSPDTNRAPDASRVTPPTAPGAGGATTITLELAGAVTDVTSPTHELTTTNGTRQLVDRHSDHDVIIRWRTPVSSAGWVEQDADGGFAAIIVASPKSTAKPGALRCTLAIDRAATTRGDADAVERPFVRGLLRTLDGGSRIAVIGSDQLAWSTPEQTTRALDAAWSRRAGAFDLTRVLAAARPEGAPIVLVSDGLIADDAAAIATARKLGVPIHVIGVGATPARGLLAQLANASGGTVRFAMPGDDLDALARDVIADLASPPAPVAVTWGTLAASDVVPAAMPRLGAGQATLVVARVKRAAPANGRARGELFSIEPLHPQRSIDGATSTGGALARRWARDRLDELVVGYAKPSVIAAHAIQYGLVSPYTSMVAIGTEVIVSGGVKHSVSVPVSVPAGMRWQPVKRETTVATTEQPAPTAPPPPPVTITQDSVKNIPIPTRGTKPVVDGRSKPDGVDHHRKHTDDAKDDRASEDKTPAPKKAGKSNDDDGDDEDKPKYKRPHKKAPREDSTEKESAKKKKGETLDEESTVDEPADVRGLAPTSRTAALDAAEGGEVMVTGSVGAPRYRLSLQLGGGLAIHGGTSGLASLSARIEFGRRTLVGLDSSLWLVGDKLSPEGRFMLGISRRFIARYLELGAGFGVHLGDGVGPAGSLRMRSVLPPLGNHVGLFLRYDTALLFSHGTSAGDNALTLGLDYAF